jgi:hypothetical protein
VNSGDHSACPSLPWLQSPFAEPGMCHVVKTEEPPQKREMGEKINKYINLSQIPTNCNKFKHKTLKYTIKLYY